jgi:(E)-4-hydroxy-3-methylbut-2-enyl-diphosphate synthase
MEIKRRKTIQVNVGGIKIGGNAPVVIQSMTKTPTKDVEATVSQIKRLKKSGCEIVRVAVKDIDDAKSIRQIKKRIDLPLVADIHFHYELALEAIKNGADKIRLNPGNIFKVSEIKEVVASAKKHKIPIRVGLNSGSVKRGSNSIADSMVKSAVDYLKILEGMDFYEIVVSLKASVLEGALEAYRKMAKLCDYPFHLGITAAGLPQQGMIKSSIGIGILLSEGIGDTVRVSLTGNPEQEVSVAQGILNALGLRKFGIEVVSCPTCGRCEVDLVDKVRRIEEGIMFLRGNHKQPKKIAIMGCSVNGPGEAKDADLGIAFGKKFGLIFKRGRVIKKVPEVKVVEYVLKELEAKCQKN